MTNNVEYKIATAGDLEAYYKDDPLHYSARAVVIVKDGEVVGVGGVCRTNKQMVVFTESKEGKMTKRDYVKAGRLLMQIINRYTSVIAFADDELSTALSFAKHYGFNPTGVRTEEGDILMRVNKPCK